MKLVFSTVVRSAPPEQSGELVAVDWDKRTVIAREPIFASNPSLDDPNPRGNTRGGRGIVLFDKQIVVSSYHTLKIFDHELRHLDDISHPLMVGLHESYLSNNGSIWVSATAIDAALQIDLSSGCLTQSRWPREMPSIQERFGVEPLVIDKQVDNRANFLSTNVDRDAGHLHLNAVTVWQGEVYAFFSKYGAIVNLDRGEVVIADPGAKGGHNLIVQDDGTAIVNGTISRTVRVYDLQTRTLRRAIDLMGFPALQRLARFYDLAYPVQATLNRLKLASTPPSRAIFVRGLDILDDLLFLGISPATIVCLDWRLGRLVDMYSYSNNVRVCVHGLKVVRD